MVRFYWRCLVGTILWLIAGLVPVIADDVTLRSADGKISLRGELKSFDGDTYVLDTEFGTLTFKALGVECQGAACPDIAQFATDLVIGAGGSTAIRLEVSRTPLRRVLCENRIEERRVVLGALERLHVGGAHEGRAHEA